MDQGIVAGLIALAVLVGFAAGITVWHWFGPASGGAQQGRQPRRVRCDLGALILERTIGVDVGASAGDIAVAVLIENGQRIAKHQWRTKGIAEHAGVVITLMREWAHPDGAPITAGRVHVDPSGIGRALIDRLAQYGYRVVESPGLALRNPDYVPPRADREAYRLPPDLLAQIAAMPPSNLVRWSDVQSALDRKVTRDAAASAGLDYEEPPDDREAYVPIPPGLKIPVHVGRTAPNRAGAGRTPTETCLIAGCSDPRAKPSQLCTEHTASLRACASRFPGHSNAGTKVNA